MWENLLNMKEFITKAKNEYMEIGKVFCPYLNTEIQLTAKGFNHLIHKGRYKRKHNEILKRLESIKLISLIIVKSGTLQEYENINTEYFGFIAIVDSKKYKVIVLKNNEGIYKFISIIPKYRPGVRL
jgi:hypothetical protein